MVTERLCCGGVGGVKLLSELTCGQVIMHVNQTAIVELLAFYLEKPTQN